MSKANLTTGPANIIIPTTNHRAPNRISTNHCTPFQYSLPYNPALLGFRASHLSSLCSVTSHVPIKEPYNPSLLAHGIDSEGAENSQYVRPWLIEILQRMPGLGFRHVMASAHTDFRARRLGPALPSGRNVDPVHWKRPHVPGGASHCELPHILWSLGALLISLALHGVCAPCCRDAITVV